MNTSDIKEVMGRLHGGVEMLHPESVVEYQMDADEFSKDVQKQKETKQPSSSNKQKNRLDFTKEEIEEINSALEEISMVLEKQKEKKEDALHSLLLQKGTEAFFKERKQMIANIVLGGVNDGIKSEREIRTLYNEFGSVDFAIKKELSLSNKEVVEKNKEDASFVFDFNKMGQKLSASSNIMSTTLSVFEATTPSIQIYKYLSEELEEIWESHLFVEDFLKIE